MPRSNTRKQIVIVLMVCLFFMLTQTLFVCATETGDVAGAVENTWNVTKEQVKRVVNNVVFPVIDLVLAILFFVKIGLAYMDYRKHGQFEFTAPAILFACLVFTLTAPLYVWDIIGM